MKKRFKVGIAIVLLLVLWYRLPGFIASISLLVYSLFMLFLFKYIPVTLTSAGIAGFIISLGMAVDANVIINERIRELLRQGVPMGQAIEHGYENAMSAILDSNITSIITSVLLYVYGTGPIKGFAITMLIGNMISMLTAILGTHGMYVAFMSYIEKNYSINFWFGMKKRGH